MVRVIILSLMMMLGTTSYAHTFQDNNPGHIVKTSIKWKGEIKCANPSRFECFSTPYWGLRAMMMNLKTYRDRYKVKTVQHIIRRWAPPNENNTTLLIRNACGYVGHDCSRPFNLHDEFNFKRMVKAILRQEGNTLVFSDYIIERIMKRYIKFKDSGWGISMSDKRKNRRERHLRDEHGITENEFQQMLIAQEGVCYICKGTPKGNANFHIDHNHDSGDIRGLLCHNCNIGLGHFKDDPDLLYAGIKYLMKPPVEQLTNVPELKGDYSNEEET